MKFALALHTDDGVKYGVTVPDLPGCFSACFSAGDTLDEAIEMAPEAIDLHLEVRIALYPPILSWELIAFLHQHLDHLPALLR